MVFYSRSALVLLLAVLGSTTDAFSPSARSSASVAQIVEQRQRYSPIFVGEVLEEEEEDLLPDIDSPPEDDYIVNVGDLEDDDDDGSEDDGQPPAWYTSQERIDELRAQHRRHEKDTGSPEFQVAGMTERISYLTKHLNQHPKDFSTRRGLVAMVNKRRRLLNYLFEEDENRYASIVSSLGIRHKPPGRVGSREEKYAQFPKQKAIKKHLIKKTK